MPFQHLPCKRGAGGYLGIILLVTEDDLRRHVDRRADAGLGARVHLVLRVAKVADLQQRPRAVPPVAVQEQVLQLQVAVGHSLHTTCT